MRIQTDTVAYTLVLERWNGSLWFFVAGPRMLEWLSASRIRCQVLCANPLPSTPVWNRSPFVAFLFAPTMISLPPTRNNQEEYEAQIVSTRSDPRTASSLLHRTPEKDPEKLWFTGNNKLYDLDEIVYSWEVLASQCYPSAAGNLAFLSTECQQKPCGNHGYWFIRDRAGCQENFNFWHMWSREFSYKKA
jgi:hypothetical protein